MQSVSHATFGPLIAYLVPGATVLVGAGQFSPTLSSWLAAAAADAPTIGGFLYLTVAALTAGMTVNAVRWRFLDTLHHHTSVTLPPLDFSKLGENVEAYSLLIRIHYEHYQFNGSMVVAVLAAYVCYRAKLGGLLPLGWIDAGVLLLEAVFFVTSRDNLRKYYSRSRQLFGVTRGKG